MTTNRRHPAKKRATPKPESPDDVQMVEATTDAVDGDNVVGHLAAEPESPAEPVVVTADLASRDRGVVVAEIRLDKTRAIRITELPADDSPAEPPLRTVEAHNDLLATAGIRASDVEAAGRLRRNGCHRAAREMMLCSLQQQADRLGIPTDFAL